MGDDLVVSVIGTTDSLTIDDWYQGWQFDVEQFKTASNKTLIDSRVDVMVQVMAGFSPSGAPSSVASLTAQQQDFATLVASNWQ